MISLISDLLARPLTTGQPAPLFTLPDQDGRTVRLADYRGRNVLLIFYPGDNTPVCTKQFCELRDQPESLRTTNTIAFGINRQNAASHASFRQKQGFDIPLLVDETGEVCRAYHATGIYTRRTVYLIDENGVIRFAERGRPDLDRVLAVTTARMESGRSGPAG